MKVICNKYKECVDSKLKCFHHKRHEYNSIFCDAMCHINLGSCVNIALIRKLKLDEINEIQSR